MNVATAVITLCLTMWVIYVFYGLKKDRRNGKSFCGGSCGSCQLCQNTKTTLNQMRKEFHDRKEWNGKCSKQ